MITALILAAGQSKRMGRAKMSLAWGETTVLGHVINVFREAGVQDVLVVCGGARAAVEEIATRCEARTIFNPHYADQGMLSSLQTGLEAMQADAEASFIALGDQPQIQASTVRLLLEAYKRARAPLIVPSYRMRRGHPWLISRSLWNALLQMQAPATPRDFLHAHADLITHIDVTTPTVLSDLDTPDDYLKSRQ